MNRLAATVGCALVASAAHAGNLRLSDFPDRTFTCRDAAGKFAQVEVHPSQTFWTIDGKRHRITDFSWGMNDNQTDEFGFAKPPVFNLTIIGGDEGNGLPELIQNDDGRWNLILKPPAAVYLGGGYGCRPNEGGLWRASGQ
jgi:hypothetical protein